jgi:hypothetical protein
VSTPSNLLEAAKALRAAQRAYMSVRDQRGGPMYIAAEADRLGAEVAKAAIALDAAIAKAEGR